jgi:spore germination protein KA
MDQYCVCHYNTANKYSRTGKNVSVIGKTNMGDNMKIKKPASMMGNGVYDDTVNCNNSQDICSKNVNDILGLSKDVVFRQVYINGDKDFPVTFVFVDGLNDSKVINDDVLKPLLQECKLKQAGNCQDVIDLIEHGVVYAANAKVTDNINELIDDILSGFSALIFDGEKKAVAFETKGFEKRSITEPSDENVLKGSRDSFVETLRINTATIRRKIKSPNLIVEESTVGQQTQTQIAVIYMKNIINERIVQQIHERIENIKIDGVLMINFLAEFLVDNKYSPFPQLVYTERPDKFCQDLLEGRAGIIIDGIPFCMIIPATFDEGLKSPDDYSHSTFMNTFKRIMRYALLLITLLLPAFYVAITSFNQEMIPEKFETSISDAREGVPFPSYIEITLMILAFEVLQEAGLRLPKAIGQTVSIIGTLVVGQAAVAARIVSAPVIIIVAVTGIASFTIPSQDLSDATKLCKLLLIAFSSIIGLFGIAMGFLLILYHLCTLESFGVPYLSPFVANEGNDMRDTLFRLPVSWLKHRPEYLKTKNKRRQE